MSKVIGDYTVVRQLGEGAFGRTFLANHTVLGKPVCLKQEKTKRQPFMDLFRREAAALWGLHHQSVASVLNYIEHPKFGQFIAMSYIEGENLGEFIEREGPIDDEHIMWIMQRLLEALSFLHYHGVIHCDIKPQNVMLQLDVHNAVLIDFGIAALAPQSDTLAIGGTKGYNPPEFESALPPVPVSDFYSLGKVAIYLAGGKPDVGVIPDDMCSPLRTLLEEMILFDRMKRRELLGDDGVAISKRITGIRQEVYKRTETIERIKFRYK